MKETIEMSNKYINPFSKRVQELSQKLDEATINKDVAKLGKLLEEARDMLDSEDFASQASIYYSMGTACGDYADLSGDSGEEPIKR